MDHPMRSLQIGFDPTVQQQKSWAVQISKLHSDGQITERRIHTYLFDDENAQCCVSGVCTACKSSLQSTPRFTITSMHKGHSPNAVLSSLIVTRLLQSGVLLSPHRIHVPKAYDAWADLSDSTATTFCPFLRKIRDLQQRFATDAVYLLFDQR